MSGKEGAGWLSFEGTENLTSWISLLAFSLCLILAVFYYFSPYESLHLQLLGISIILLIPVILVYLRLDASAALLICLLACLLPMMLSVYNKTSALGINTINAVNYFDVRLVIISGIIIPMTIIPLRRYKLLILGCLPSLLALALFDPLHNWLGVGYYQAGLTGKDYYFSANLFSGFSWIFLIMAFLFLKSKVERGRDKERRRREYLEEFMRSVMEIGNSPAFLQGRIRDGYREVIACVLNVMPGSEVTVWEFEAQNTQLICVEGQSEQNGHMPGSVLEYVENEEYFSKLLKQGIVLSGQMLETAEIHGSRSFMDVLFVTGGTYGVLSCEIKNAASSQKAEDSLFLKALADMLSLLHANNAQRRRNDELESRVNARTIELKKSNDELKAYAFLNAHILRAPIARVYGMYQVIEAHYAEHISPEVMDHFRSSIQDLDEITRKIDEKAEVSG